MQKDQRDVKDMLLQDLDLEQVGRRGRDGGWEGVCVCVCMGGAAGRQTHKERGSEQAGGMLRKQDGRRPFLTWHGDVTTPRIVSLGRNSSSLSGPAGAPAAATSHGGGCQQRWRSPL